SEVYPFRWKQKNFTTEDTEKIEDTEKRRLYAISLCPSFLCGENEFPPTSIHYRRFASSVILPAALADRLIRPPLAAATPGQV
ncbi:MAG: hypothetical protein OXN88_12195, partial [Chloroflexota bacterium]|nr:hypothetical protein [Chloroflexota bacterium]